MATSSSDGSSKTPADFNLSAELEELSPRVTTAKAKCPLCRCNRPIFYCEQCVRNGDIVASTSIASERFSEKQLRLLRLKAEKAIVEQKCMEILQRRRERDRMMDELNSRKARIELLRKQVTSAKKRVDKGKQELAALTEQNNRRRERIEITRGQTNTTAESLVVAKATKEKQQEALDKKKHQLQKFRQSSIKELTTYIFPLSEVKPSERSLCRVEGGQTKYDVITSALAEASGTSYVRGRWITDTGKNLETHYRIVRPTLPASGNYNAYSLWVAATREGPPGANKENSMHNPACNISAALTYTTQLVNMMACYLDVRLPHKVSYEEFCGNEMSDHKFLRKVARLNSNVLHLCLSQNVDHRYLHPRHTLQNLLHLLNPMVSDLGRIGPMLVDSAIADRLHSHLSKHLELSDDDSASDEEDINGEWEAVPNVGCPEMTVPNPGRNPSQQASTSQVNQSIAGGLVTSAAASLASLWRGWTNR